MLAELLALASGVTGDEAARLLAEVQLPVGELVEAIDGRKIVHAEMTVHDEALVLLMSEYDARRRHRALAVDGSAEPA